MTISITIDCTDAARVATFWGAALGRPVADDASAAFASIAATADGPGLAFVQVPEGKSAKNRLHLDLSVADRAAEVARLVGLGATVQATYDEGGSAWTTLVDVEGNEFCVV